MHLELCLLCNYLFYYLFIFWQVTHTQSKSVERKRDSVQKFKQAVAAAEVALYCCRRGQQKKFLATYINVKRSISVQLYAKYRIFC